MTNSLQRTAPGNTRRDASGRGSRSTRLAVLVAALLVSALAGAGLALLLFSGAEGNVAVASATPGDDSVEAGFARDMMVHHAQAVQMAEIVRGKTESEEIRLMASDIALTQQGQIGQMQGWLGVWGLPATGEGPAMGWMGHPTEGRMPGMASPQEINELQQASPEEADVQFLQLMIPHHEAAIPMAETALDETERPEVRQLATAIASSQQGEIQLMQELLQNRGVAPGETSGDEHSHDDAASGADSPQAGH